jgi:hypothetical protein
MAPAQTFGVGTGVLTVSLKIPRAARVSKARRRRPQYISPATSSVTVAVDGAGASAAVATCTSSSCTVTLDLAVGTHTLAFRLWDAPNGGGNELASNTAGTCAVVLGDANTCTLTMYGDAASLEMTTTSTAVSGSQTAGYTFLSGAAVPFTIDALDADGYEMLAGVGAITPSVSTTGTGITIVTPAPNAAPVYSITDQNPATQTLTLSSTPAPNSDGSPITTNVSLAGETCAQNAITGQGVPLGTAATFAVLANTTVTNAGASVVSGNLGVSPGTAVTGFNPPGVVENGAIHAGDATAAQAQIDLATAYGNATGRTGATPLAAADLAGLTLTPGVYSALTSEGLTGTVTLDGQNDPNSVFIIQIGTSFIVAGNSTVTLINKADPCNVFWTIGTSMTLAANAAFAGTVMANTSVTLAAGVSVHGRVMTQGGAVTLSDNAVTVTRP